MHPDDQHQPLTISTHSHATGVLFQHRTGAHAIRDRLGGGQVIVARPDETIAQAIARQTARLTLMGALLGGAILALLTALGALSGGIDPSTAGGVAAAVGLTGGPFFGALAGFVLAVLRSEHLDPVVRGLPISQGAALLVIRGPGDAAGVALHAALAPVSGDVS